MGNVSYKSHIKSEKQGGYIGKLLCCGLEGERGETLGGNVKGTDKLLAESLAAAGDMQSNPHAGISAFVYSEDTLKALFTSLSGE